MSEREKLIERLQEVAEMTPPVCDRYEPYEIDVLGKTVTVYCKPFEEFQALVRRAVSALREQENKPKTHADRIRAMSDEELAEFLAYTWATSARAWQKDPGETLAWLQQAEEDGHEAGEHLQGEAGEAV